MLMTYSFLEKDEKPNHDIWPFSMWPKYNILATEPVTLPDGLYVLVILYLVFPK